ncbi:putative alpha-1,6-mannosyltransferase mnn11 [Exophiala xenobiotica]|uniref:Alpha-1,6-mannosyltransferase mnn11 n=1 Tax=Lithohypha guttulata TaxID=1690604 RepID=A0ABR0KLI8_9EURO|nr:putative alpha-1,6-mannosyltransferase mnn11 [Lithohypha guttulata]KAK5323582.1 putative alpha-1,6-mannosyltransferase mnn11 [Exophiala xenobiotica]
MALSVPPPQTTWDRTLPNPAALLSNGIDPRRSSSLLQHHISSDQFLAPAADESGRRSTLPCLPRPENDETIEELRQRQGSVMSGEEATESSSEGTSPPESSGFCLCVPEPKIPRPRNAFILYRQHQHAPVVAQHPGLPNPDISKIIGAQWKQLSEKDKNEWKALAEQEKARHAQQFPEYRYRPKRSAKFPPLEGVSENQPASCAKCGGKTMNPPHTPHYSAFDHHPSTIGMQRPQKRAYTEAHVQPLRAQPMVQIAPHPQARQVRYAYGPPPPRHESIAYARGPPPAQHAPQYVAMEGPEAKRRRIDSPYAPRPSYDHAYYERDRSPAPYHPDQVVRMPPPAAQRPSHPPAPVAGPSRPIAPIQQRRDPSLTLPPLKTGAAPRSAVSSNAQTQKSGVEAMIMSYPVLTKLKTLHSITPLLSVPGPSSPPHEVRGAIIAIEGLDQRRVLDMTNSLAEQLGREDKFMVKIFAGPNPYQALQSSRRASLGQSGDCMSTEKYLNLISEWHKVSKEIVNFITHRPGTGTVEEIKGNDHEMPDVSARPQDKPKSPFDRSPSNKTPISAVSPMTKTVEHAGDMDIDNTPAEKEKDGTTTPTRVTRSRIPQAALDQQAQKHREPVTAPTPPPASERPQTPPPPVDCQKETSPKTASADAPDLIPIALVPHYQLTTVDTCSIALPITDNYDPLTHWRWHATLWRGCIGPDISVVIKSAHEQYEDDALSGDSKKTSSGVHPPHPRAGSVAPAPPSGTPQPQPRSSIASTEQTSSAPAPFGVEVRLQDHRAVIVRTAGSSRGSNTSETLSEKDLEKANDNWEKAKRRVGFEVEESLRR